MPEATQITQATSIYYDPADPFTASMALCDHGMMRGIKDDVGTVGSYQCTAHMHFAGKHIRCTSPAHGEWPVEWIEKQPDA